MVEILVKEGDTVAEGSAVAILESGDAVAPEPESAAPEIPAEAEAPVAVAPEPQETATAERIIAVPDTGGSEGVEVIELCVAPGDTVAEGDSLIVLESDKASMEVPCPASGEILELLVKEGDQVSDGDPIARLLAVSGPAADGGTPPQDSVDSAPAAPSTDPDAGSRPRHIAVLPAPTGSRPKFPDNLVYAGPAVRKTARELGVDLTQVKGSGPRGRLLKEDLQDFVKAALQSPVASGGKGMGIPSIPDIDYAQFGEIDIQDRSRLHKLTAANMQRSWLNVPHVTQYDDALADPVWQDMEFRRSNADVVDQFVSGEVDEVHLLFTRYVNALTFKPGSTKFLPIEPEAAKEGDGPKLAHEYDFEPEPAKILEKLVPRYVEVSFHRLLLESMSSEHAARMSAMRNATDSATDMIDELTLIYNNARQSGR